MSVKLLTEHHLEFLSLKGVCTVSYESTLVKMPHCWKSHVTPYFSFAVAEQLIAQHSAIKMLHSRVKLILEYIKAVESGRLIQNPRKILISTKNSNILYKTANSSTQCY